MRVLLWIFGIVQLVRIWRDESESRVRVVWKRADGKHVVHGWWGIEDGKYPLEPNGKLSGTSIWVIYWEPYSPRFSSPFAKNQRRLKARQ